ncbi:response regulator receiver protein [Methanolacinia petrolearia DSM 11571]|uniref:Response regulator receiver protein n=1 Tax=Methanolacinia petrolearia (strain DSM 11571 / OCM 486 / SEBR 4847) TaxID=679926 RepID=E1RHQ1_METP4|nr:response regulator [Methanolacinia petrolearia]ADN35360.1 response regulator receiver protein [Methanolacinia petrolearia DSM 11571]
MHDKKILVVEDDAIISELIMWRLKDLGYANCKFVSSGEAAVEEARMMSPDLILMDVTLDGDLDGIDAIKEIKKFMPGVPFVYLSSHMENDIIERALETKPSGYIAKPFEDFELRMGIEIALMK